MNEPLVTILTPTYNHELYIEKCLNSVINQGYVNWELIAIDDKSNDKTLRILKFFERKDPRIKVISHKRNWGVAKLVDTYNQGLKLSKGKYLAILEGDDFWPKHKLDEQISLMEKNKKAVLSYGNSIFTNAYSIPIKLHRFNFEKKYLENRPVGSILKLFCDLSFSIIPVTVIMKTNILKRMKGFKKDKIYPFADIPTFLSLSILGEFLYIDKNLGFYRKQPNSEWFNFASQTSAMGREELKKSIGEFLKKYSKNKIVKQIKANRILEKQDKYIFKRKKYKKVSIILNSIAFGFPISPLTIVFIVQLIFWKLKKLFAV